VLKAATTSIPVVALTYDPVALGLAKSLARPGGNFTGVTVDTGPALYGKRVELLREVAPGMTRFGFVTSRRVWDMFQGAMVRGAAETTHLAVSPFLVDLPATVDQYRKAVLAAGADGVGALIVGDSPETLQYRSDIVRAVAETGLPAMYTFPESVEAGGLIAYSFDLTELNRRAASNIDAILRGANPGEIPFYQLTRLILSVNMGTAKSLGITFPPSMLARADEVIE
jgi:putative ABC transport system substrate-binding protein